MRHTHASVRRSQKWLKSLRIWFAMGTAVVVFLVGLGITKAGFATDSTSWLFEESAQYVFRGEITRVTLMKANRAYDNIAIPDIVYEPTLGIDEDLSNFIVMPQRGYTLDFRHEFSQITPLHKNSYLLEEMNSLQGLESVRSETADHVRWILHHSIPYLDSPAACARIANLPELSERDVIVATQTAIWKVVTGVDVSDFGWYEGRTEHVNTFYKMLVSRSITDEADQLAASYNSDVQFAKVEIRPGGSYASERRGRYGPFRIYTNVEGVENCDVWLEDMTESENGAVITDASFRTLASATQEPTRTIRAEIGPDKDFYVDTYAAMTPNGRITLRVSSKIMLSYQSELMVWDQQMDSDGKLQYASLLTAGRFVSKPSTSVEITWGEPSVDEADIKAAQSQASLESLTDENKYVIVPEHSYIQPMTDTVENLAYETNTSIVSYVAKGDPTTPHMLIVLPRENRLRLDDWLEVVKKKLWG